MITFHNVGLIQYLCSIGYHCYTYMVQGIYESSIVIARLIVGLGCPD